MDELHSDRVVEVMKKGLNKSKAPVLVILHDRLEHVKSDDLSLLIESAEETNRPSICLITKKTNDSIGMSLLENFSTELTSLEKCHGKGILEKASFLFTEYDEYSKSKFGTYHLSHVIHFHAICRRPMLLIQTVAFNFSIFCRGCSEITGDRTPALHLVRWK